MRRLLIVTFDLVRNNEPETSLAAGYLISYLKAQKEYGHSFLVEHLPFNLLKQPELTPAHILETMSQKHKLMDIDAIAIGCYIWSDHLTRPVIKGLRKLDFNGRIILGGYQISCTNIAASGEYPEADVFIPGYGEAALTESFLTDDLPRPSIVSAELDLTKTPSPYLTNEIKVRDYQKRIRMETKRGCPNNCSFCGHQDLYQHRLYVHPIETVLNEFSYMKTKMVRKINVVDPFFNCGKDYIEILDYCYRIGVTSRITLQTRFDPIRDEVGARFINRCASLNVSLEFGLQSILPEELAALNRTEDIDHAKKVMTILKAASIPYSVSLMYGIPNQTVDSLRRSVTYLLTNGCQNVNVFPLMLLPGTVLWSTKDQCQLKEEPLGRLGMPLVVSGDSFDKVDWHAMKGIAGSLRRKYRSHSSGRVL